MTEEEVELTELQASMPSSKGGLSYLSQTAPMEAKRNVETAAKGGLAFERNSKTRLVGFFISRHV